MGLQDDARTKSAVMTYSFEPSRTLPTVFKSGSTTSATVLVRLARGGSLKGSLPACAVARILSKYSAPCKVCQAGWNGHK